MIHECNEGTVPPCETNKLMVVAQMFTEARKSPDFLAQMFDRLRVLEGMWSRYVSYTMDFGQVPLHARTLSQTLFLTRSPFPPCCVSCVSSPSLYLQHQHALSRARIHTHTRIASRHCRTCSDCLMCSAVVCSCTVCAGDEQGDFKLLFDEGLPDNAPLHRGRNVSCLSVCLSACLRHVHNQISVDDARLSVRVCQRRTLRLSPSLAPCATPLSKSSHCVSRRWFVMKNQLTISSADLNLAKQIQVSTCQDASWRRRRRRRRSFHNLNRHTRCTHIHRHIAREKVKRLLADFPPLPACPLSLAPPPPLISGRQRSATAALQ